jgi:hypothetical protein
MCTITVGETSSWTYPTSGITPFTRAVYVGLLDTAQDGGYPLQKGSHPG